MSDDGTKCLISCWKAFYGQGAGDFQQKLTRFVYELSIGSIFMSCCRLGSAMYCFITNFFKKNKRFVQI